MLDRAGIGFQSVTELVPLTVESAELVALTVTVLLDGATAGPVYTPDTLIVPVAEPPPVTLFTCQVTAEFDVPETAALKFCVVPARTFALAGEILTVTPEPGEGGLDLELPELVVDAAQLESRGIPSKRENARSESKP